MPRISAAAWGTVLAAELPFPPPAHLNEAEKLVFQDIVGSADPKHFRCEDRELLALYCAHVVAARALMKRKRRTSEETRELRETSRLILSLSARLRLGPKSRAPDDRRAASAGLRPPGPRPWDRPADGAEDHPRAPEAPRRWDD